MKIESKFFFEERANDVVIRGVFRTQKSFKSKWNIHVDHGFPMLMVLFELWEYGMAQNTVLLLL